MAPAIISSVDAFAQILRDLLQKASDVKHDGGIEQAIEKQPFGERIQRIGEVSGTRLIPTLQAQYAAIETASRNIMYELIATTSITDPAFDQVWDLLDIVTLLSDTEQCEIPLAFWLVEELLDSQTIDGCRLIFDYLESRRERMCAHRLSKKALIILRACNELLRRLSRAEDTVFCGRVFIYMFQSFPLGDKSSVNLRGEFHTENVTMFDEPTDELDKPLEELMEVDSKVEHTIKDAVSPLRVAATNGVADESTVEASEPPIEVDGTLDRAGKAEEDSNNFYCDFWALQRNFAMPTRLFEGEHFNQFKEGLGSTLRKFQTVDQSVQTRNTSHSIDDKKRSMKRKRGQHEEELSDSFNPKYLTSRDLFDLEISDLAFRRHILVQALILIDFLLSLTPKAKKRLAGKANKSVLYSYALSEEDTEWAIRMRSDIAMYLQQGPEGKFYYRMVDTVLSRDKNWTHWKAESCPKIQRPPVSAEEFVEAQKGAQKACVTRKLKPNPLGSVNLNFLSEAESGDGLKKLTNPERYSVPTVESFKGPIADDDFEIDTAKDQEEKQLLKDARASKIWRTLRIASKSKFKLFHKIEDGNDLEVLFEPKMSENRSTVEGDGTEAQALEATEGSEQLAPTDGLLEIPQ